MRFTNLSTEYRYTSELLVKAQVHIKFPHVILSRKSFEKPIDFFIYTFRIKGDRDRQINVVKSLINFMELMQLEKVDLNSLTSYYPLYILESRYLLKVSKGKLALNKKAKLWLEAMHESIAIEEHGYITNES